MDNDIESRASSCASCKEHQDMPASAPLHHWKWPATPWYRVHTDFAEIYNTHFLLLTDAHSKWLEVAHMPSKTNATATIHTLRNIFSTHGLPVHLVSDNGPPFTSVEFETFMKQNGIYHVRTPPFHPSSNGAAEKAVQTFKRALQKDTSTVPLKHKLANFLLSYRTTPHSATGQAPCILLMRRSIRRRLDLVHPSLTDVISRHQKSQCLSHDNSQPLQRFAVGGYGFDSRLFHKSGQVFRRNYYASIWPTDV